MPILLRAKIYICLVLSDNIKNVPQLFAESS